MSVYNLSIPILAKKKKKSATLNFNKIIYRKMSQAVKRQFYF